MSSKRISSWSSAPILPLSLATMVVFMVGGALHDTPTVDEPNHIVRGMALLETGDGRLNIAHPPLANLVQAVPGRILGHSFEVESREGWESWNLDEVIESIIAADYEAFREVLFAGRFSTLVSSLLLGVYLYFLTRERFGIAAARATLVILALHPVFLAHGRLVTTDLAITMGVVLTAGELWRYLTRPGLARLLSLGAALGFACAAKFTGVFLVVPLVFLVVLHAEKGSVRFPQPKRSSRFLHAARDLAIVGVLACLIVNLSYGFDRTGMTVGEILRHEPQPTNWITQNYEGQVLERASLLPALPAWLPVPFPYPYVFGLFTIKAQNEKGHAGWFMGEKAWFGHPLYFPIMGVIKSPIGLLALFLIGIVSFFRGRRRWKELAMDPLVAIPVFFGVVLLNAQIQIGVRHAMPVLVFTVVFAGWAAARAWDGGSWKRAGVVCAIALLAMETMTAHPHHISHFSWLIGGPSVGHEVTIMGEDWGQDVAELARVAQDEGLEPLLYQPYGKSAFPELARRGLRARRLACGERVEGPGWYAIHAAHARRGICLSVPSDRRPDRIINHHIWLYRLGDLSPRRAGLQHSLPH